MTWTGKPLFGDGGWLALKLPAKLHPKLPKTRPTRPVKRYTSTWSFFPAQTPGSRGFGEFGLPIAKLEGFPIHCSTFFWNTGSCYNIGSGVFMNFMARTGFSVVLWCFLDHSLYVTMSKSNVSVHEIFSYFGMGTEHCELYWTHQPPVARNQSQNPKVYLFGM